MRAHPKQMRGPGLEEHLSGRNVADLQELAAFWLPAEEAAQLHDLAPLQEALARQMSCPEGVSSRVGFLRRGELRALGQVVMQPGHCASRQELRQGLPEGSPAEVMELEHAIDRLRDRGFLAEVRPPPPASRRAIRYCVPVELARELQGLLGQDHAPSERFMSCAAYLEGLTEHQLRRRLRRLSRTGGRAEQRRRAVARCGNRELVERRLAELPRHLAVVARQVRDRYAGLAFREELQREDPGLEERWRSREWGEALESSLLGTVKSFSLVERGLRRQGEAMVIFAEAVAASGDGDSPEETVEPGAIASAGLAVLPLVERIIGLAQLEPLRVTRKEGALYQGARSRLVAELERGRAGQLRDPGGLVDLAVGFAARTGLVEVNDDRQVAAQARASHWWRRPAGDRLEEILDLVLGSILQETSLPVSQATLVGLVTGAGIGCWVPLERLHRRLRVLVASGRGGRAAAGGPAGGGATVADSPEGVLETVLSPFHLLGLVDLGLEGPPGGEGVRPAVTHLRLSRLGEGLLLHGELPEVPGEVRPLVVNPDFQVLVLPTDGAERAPLVAELEGFADLEGGDEVLRFRLSADSVRRAVAAGRDAASSLQLLEGRSRAGVPANVAYSVRDWGEEVQVVEAREVVLLRARSPEAVERILRLEATGQVEMERVGDLLVALPGRSLEGPEGARLMETLREAGVLLEQPEACE